MGPCHRPWGWRRHRGAGWREFRGCGPRPRRVIHRLANPVMPPVTHYVVQTNQVHHPPPVHVITPAPTPVSNVPGYPGWEAKVDPTGRTYYEDHHTQTTHWQLPAAAPVPIYT